MATLYLLETRAAKTYACAGCGAVIARGALHFRHDPHPLARRHRGETYSHWCQECIRATNPGEKELITRRLFVDRKSVRRDRQVGDQQQLLFEPVRVEIVGVGARLSGRLAAEPCLVHTLSPEEFEEFICERLFAMELEPRRVGGTFQGDGGIDVVFWPRRPTAFPFLGAAQIKHHRDANQKEGPDTVREFAGSISGRPFSAGIVVTNTSFSANAEWFARQHGGLIRLRGFDDICRWLADNFSSEEEWRELPSSIELAPGIVVRVK